VTKIDRFLTSAGGWGASQVHESRKISRKLNCSPPCARNRTKNCTAICMQNRTASQNKSSEKCHYIFRNMTPGRRATELFLTEPNNVYKYAKYTSALQYSKFNFGSTWIDLSLLSVLSSAAKLRCRSNSVPTTMRTICVTT
jgi:hypothetical protein